MIMNVYLLFWKGGLKFKHSSSFLDLLNEDSSAMNDGSTLQMVKAAIIHGAARSKQQRLDLYVLYTIQE